MVGKWENRPNYGNFSPLWKGSFHPFFISQFSRGHPVGSLRLFANYRQRNETSACGLT